MPSSNNSHVLYWWAGLYVAPVYVNVDVDVVLGNIKRLIIENQLKEFTRIADLKGWPINSSIPLSQPNLRTFDDSDISFEVMSGKPGQELVIGWDYSTEMPGNYSEDTLRVTIGGITNEYDTPEIERRVAVCYQQGIQNIFTTVGTICPSEFVWRPKGNTESAEDYSRWLRRQPNPNVLLMANQSEQSMLDKQRGATFSVNLQLRFHCQENV